MLANVDDNRQEFHHHPSASHQSHPAQYSTPYDTNSSRNGISEWDTNQLVGPGMPVARNFVSSAAASVVPEVDTDAAAGDGEGDGDDGKTYCFCDRVSFGEMIACDDENCEKEWVSVCHPFRRDFCAHYAFSSTWHVSASKLYQRVRGFAKRASASVPRSDQVEEESAVLAVAALVVVTRLHDLKLYIVCIYLVCVAFPLIHHRRTEFIS